ncbi:MAG TPA: hypothetical protein VH855_18620 [Acetobacteraceae bacterium]
MDTVVQPSATAKAAQSPAAILPLDENVKMLFRRPSSGLRTNIDIRVHPSSSMVSHSYARRTLVNIGTLPLSMPVTVTHDHRAASKPSISMSTPQAPTNHRAANNLPYPGRRRMDADRLGF